MPFIVRYLLVAAVASLAVYVGSSFVPAGLFSAETVSPEESASGEVAFTYPDETAKSPSVTTPSFATPHSKKTVKSASAVTAPDAKSAEVVQEAPSASEVQVIDAPAQEEVVYSTSRIRSSGHDVTHWGVVISDTSFYDKDGKNREDKLVGGTLIEQCGSKKSSKGEMAVCRVWRGNTWAGPYLVSTAALIRFAGGREEVPADALDDLCKYYKLNGAAERRKEDLTQKAASQNPYYAELKKKATAYNEHRKRAEALTAERDAAKGPKRSKIIAELTELKNSEARESTEVKELTKKYEDWKKAHPSSAVGGDFSSDKTINDYYRQMSEIKPKLSMFGL